MGKELKNVWSSVFEVESNFIDRAKKGFSDVKDRLTGEEARRAHEAGRKAAYDESIEGKANKIFGNVKRRVEESYDDLRSGVNTAKSKLGDSVDDLKSGVKGAAGSLKQFAEENPGKTGAVAAAIAAGLGGLALAKKLRRTKK